MPTPDTLHHIDLTLLTIQQMNNNLLASFQDSNSEVLAAIDKLKIDLKPETKSWTEKNAVVVGAIIGIISAAISSLITGHLTKKRENREREAKNREFEANAKKENKNYLKKHYGELLAIHLQLIDSIRQRETQAIMDSCMNEILRIEKDPVKLEKYQIKKAKIVEKRKVEHEKFAAAHKEYVSKIGEYIAHKENDTTIPVALEGYTNALSFVMGKEHKQMRTIQEIQDFSKAEVARYEAWWKINVNQASLKVINCVLYDK